MRETWARAFRDTAKAHWTDARTERVTAGKQMAVLPGEAPVLLRAMGLLHRKAKMPAAQIRKYRQINHMVAVLRPALDELIASHRPVRVIDAACGRSYLSLLLAWWFRERRGHPVQILGLERVEAMVDTCRDRAALATLDDRIRFAAGDLANVDWRSAWADRWPDAPDDEAAPATSGVPDDAEPEPALHALLALHACDTATDDAIALGVDAGAELIAVAPCCQAELARHWRALGEAPQAAGAFAPIWRTPHLRRHTAAEITDTMRMLLLRAAGYAARALEFVPSEHTPKNTLIRARRRPPGPDTDRDARQALDDYRALVVQTGGHGIALADRLPLPEPTR